MYKLSVGLSAPARVTQAGQTFTAPLLLARVPLWARPILHFLPFQLDGLLGWPEVRDNILVFDYEQRAIERVEQLPPETSGWLKLKVAPADSLLLELPLANGARGLISVNIGLETARAGIRMSAVPWREWQATHTRTSTTNEVKIGPLTLTDVTVKEIPAREAGDLLEQNPSTQCVWQLGSAALARLDLVVDGIHGWAYLHPKTQPTNGSLTVDGHWQLADSVRLARDNLLVYSGWFKWCQQDLTGAWTDYQQARQLNPRNAGAWSGGGAIRQVQGDFAGAVSNYDQVIQLRPDNSDWERLDRQTLAWRLGQPAGAIPASRAVAAERPVSAVMLDPMVVRVAQPAGSVPWSRVLRLFMDGSLDEKALLTAAKQKHGARTVAAQKAQAWYYLGQARLRLGDTVGASGWFKKCQAAGIKEDNEYFFAVAELARQKAAAPR
jgi:tetratricopeptide (TPR) repeat protein